MDLTLLNNVSSGNVLTEEQAHAVKKLITFYEMSYVMVEWPHSQEYMEEEWFDDEAILVLGQEEIFGSSAYFIPSNRIIK